MITLHHLNFSRSTRVIWLLEEIGIEYNLVAHQRGADFRAPPALKAVHPLGKAPVIEDGDLKLAESGAILRYIDSHYADGRFSPTEGSQDGAVHDEWLQYVESSAALPIMMLMIGGMAGGLPEGLAGFAQPELQKTLDYIERSVAAGPYLMGDQFTLADIQMSYMLDLADSAGMLTGRDGLKTYLERAKARPAFAKAVEVGGPMAYPRQ